LPSEGKGAYETIHEFDFLYTIELELYFVIAFWGIEYCINLGGQEIDGYLNWLKTHDNVSPLYADGKNADIKYV